MTLSTTQSRIAYAGNGATTAFSFPYYFLANADLVVIEKNDTTGVETTKTLTTHYTVAGAGVQAGGTVTMLTAPASGVSLIIYRDPAATQGIDLEENGSLPAESVEQGLDRAAMVSQRIKDLITRAVRLPDGFTATFDTELPGLLPADTYLKVNAAGTGLEVVALGAASTIVLPGGAGMAAYTGSNTFVARTLTGSSTITVADGTGASANPTFSIPLLGVGTGELADGAVTLPKLATGAKAKRTVSTKTANYTATTSDDILLCDATSGNITITLPTAVGNSGLELTIIKIDSSTNTVTIDGNASETVGGSTTVVMYTLNETFVIVSDGSNFRILPRKATTAPASYTPTFTGWGTVTSIDAYWARDGKFIEIWGRATSGTSTATEARISLPNSWTSSADQANNPQVAGNWAVGTNSGTYMVVLSERSVGYITFATQFSGATGLSKANGSDIIGGSIAFSWRARLPITGWVD